MSWGATAYTPIITYNSPPFGFHEIQNPPDFPRCFANPWRSASVAKNCLQTRLKKQCQRRKTCGADVTPIVTLDAAPFVANNNTDTNGTKESFIGGKTCNDLNMCLLITMFILVLYNFY